MRSVGEAGRQRPSMRRLFIISAVVGASVFAFLMLENKLIIGNTPCLKSPSTAIYDVSGSGPMITTTSEINQSTPSSLSLFDKMHKELHKRAALPNHSAERKKYELGVSIPRGSGGLMDSDRELLAEIYYNADSVFEFGLGESTKIAAWVGVPRYVGVDSDADWVTNTRNEVNMDHFRFIFADIGDTVKFGYPKNDKLQKIPLSYQSAPLNDEGEAFDFYLVDGRYRVACACSSMLHAMSRGGDMTEVMVGVHDYYTVRGRGEYHQLEQLGDIVRKSERLAVFKVKSNTTELDIYQMWEKNVNANKRR